MSKQTKIRPGLYQVIGSQENVAVTYDIERNDGEIYTRNIGRWIVTSHVGSESSQWDEDYTTLTNAAKAVAEIDGAGHYEYKNGLGWCYTEA